MTSLPPPFIHLENVHNLRALVTSPNSHPLLYRSASLSKITPQGLQTLHKLGIRTIFDLRSNTELKASDSISQSLNLHSNTGPKPTEPTSAPPTISRIHTPVFSETDYSPAALARRFSHYASADTTAGFVTAYTEILEAGGPAFRPIFEFLRDASDGDKCLVHCTAGKDRTGVFCALVLLLAGCTDDIVADEYALTDLGLADQKEEIVERLMKVDALKGDREGVERMAGAKRENMLATLQVVKERYGGVEGYMKLKCGLEDEDIRGIKEKVTGK